MAVDYRMKIKATDNTGGAFKKVNKKFPNTLIVNLSIKPSFERIKDIEKIEEINLDEKEKSEFLHSVEAVKKLWEAASKIDPDLAKK